MADQATSVPSRNIPLVDEDRFLSFPWGQFFAGLWLRTGGGNGIGNITTGWFTSTGTGSRTALDMDWGQSVSNPPTQAEMQAIVLQVQKLTKHLGQLINDEITFRSISE